jgi:hypothetical protein
MVRGNCLTLAVAGKGHDLGLDCGRLDRVGVLVARPMPGMEKPRPKTRPPRRAAWTDAEVGAAVEELIRLDPSLQKVRDRAAEEWDRHHRP